MHAVLCVLFSASVGAGLVAQASRPAQSRPAKPAAVRSPIVIERAGQGWRVILDGKLFTAYRTDRRLPVLFPVIGAAGRAMTRGYPIEPGPDDARDHPHHESLWFTHGAVNGHDFWHDPKARIVQRRASASHGSGLGTILCDDDWVFDGKVICKDRRALAFWGNGDRRFINYEVTLIASEGDVVFGDTKEGSMALRVTPALRVEGKFAKGTLVNSEGLVGKKAWGKRARWVSYSGPVAGATVGFAVFDHPRNHGYPCRWHARAYGLVAANPWGIHDFEKGVPAGTGDQTLAKGKTMTLRYRYFFFKGPADKAAIDKAWTEFSKYANKK